MLQDFTPVRSLRPAARCVAALLCAAACALASAQDITQTILTPVTSVGARFAAAGFGPEGIAFSGSATIKSKFGRDPDLNKPVLAVMIDMNGVVGIGKTSGKRFPLTSQYTLTVPFSANQTIELVVPIATSSDAAMSAVRTGLATFAFNTDPSTGAITSASFSMTTR